VADGRCPQGLQIRCIRITSLAGRGRRPGDEGLSWTCKVRTGPARDADQVPS
jgi:hypothetical protein